MYQHSSGTLEIKFKLDFPYQVDAVLMLGDFMTNRSWENDLVGPYVIFVGFSENYLENTECKDPPYLVETGSGP